jgi:hypothetical protein
MYKRRFFSCDSIDTASKFSPGTAGTGNVDSFVCYIYDFDFAQADRAFSP